MKPVMFCIICLFIVSCAGQHQAKKDQKRMQKIAKCGLNSNYSVSMKYVKEDFYGKESIQFYFDIAIENRSNQPRWFIFPSYISVDQTYQNSSQMSSLDVDMLLGKGTVLLGTFYLDANIQVIHVPPHANILVHNLPLITGDEFSDRVKKNYRIEISIAREIFIQDKTLTLWLGKEIMSSASAVVDYKNKKGFMSKHTPLHKSGQFYKSVPKTIDYDCAFGFIFSYSKESVIRE